MSRRLLALTLLLFAFGAQAEKPGLVLLNIQGPDIADHDRDQYRAVLAESLGSKYTVYSGSDVDARLQKTAKKVCDDVQCLQDVAIGYQATLIGRGIVVREAGGYSVTVEVMDIFQNRVELIRTEGCRGCDKFGVFEALRRIAGGTAPTGPRSSAERLSADVTASSGDGPAVVILDSDPSGAEVWVGGKKAGETPWQKLDGKAGSTLKLELRKPLYLNRAIEIALHAGVNEVPIVRLDSNFGTVLVESTPTGAGVKLLDAQGRAVASGTTPASLKVEPGDYRLEIAKAGHASAAFSVNVAKGKLLRIAGQEATLRALQGTVIVTSEPFEKGAEVWSGSSRLGTVPATVTLPVGEHEIEVRGTHGRGQAKVTVADGRTATLAVKLGAGAASAGKAGRDCPECPEMVAIPAGTFRMGDLHGDGQSDEKPVHEVRVKAFRMARTEVTQAQWRAVMGNNPSGFQGCDDCPVEQVSWDDAQEYLKRLSKKTGKNFRLPSEAEWEYGCRGGGTHKFCGSDNGDAVAWHEGNSGGKTRPVGQKQANAFGLYDMSGNVREWTQDCGNEGYNGAPTDGSAWASGNCGKRVLRGGSWDNNPRISRAAYRDWGGPVIRIYDRGFRPVQD